MPHWFAATKPRLENRLRFVQLAPASRLITRSAASPTSALGVAAEPHIRVGNARKVLGHEVRGLAHHRIGVQVDRPRRRVHPQLHRRQRRAEPVHERRHLQAAHRVARTDTVVADVQPSVIDRFFSHADVAAEHARVLDVGEAGARRGQRPAMRASATTSANPSAAIRSGNVAIARRIE